MEFKITHVTLEGQRAAEGPSDHVEGLTDEESLGGLMCVFVCLFTETVCALKKVTLAPCKCFNLVHFIVLLYPTYLF